MTSDTPVVDLQQHQSDAVEWLREHPRALLGHDVGLGKTVTAISHIMWLLQTIRQLGRQPGLVLWLTEANLLAQTKAEFSKFAAGLCVLTSVDRIYRSQTPKARLDLMRAIGPDGPDVLIVSYGSLRETTAIYRRFRQPELVVCDEVQAIKGGDKRFADVLEMTRPAPRVLAMTATPMQKNVIELWHVLAALHLPDLRPKETFGQRYALWSEAYCPDKSRPWMTVDPKPIGLVDENVAELRELVWRYMHRVVVADVDVQIPFWSPDSGPRWIMLSQSQTAAYRTTGPGGVGYVARTQTSRVHEGDSALVDEFVGLVGPDGEFADEPKLIVSCGTLDVVALLGERLDAARIGYRSIEGKTTPMARSNAIRDFWEDQSVRVLVGSDVLETGLNLQCARLLISLDCSENSMRERQREGRIRRIGSPFSSVTHVTLMPDTPQARSKWARLEAEEHDARRVVDPI